MNNKKILIKSAVLLLSFAMCICLFFAACAEEGGEQESGGHETAEPFEPAVDKGEDDELYIRYDEYKVSAALAFQESPRAGKESFSYEITDGRVKITKYVGNEPVVVIPGMIDGATVTEIAAGAFTGRTVVAVSIPDTVEVIEKGIFVDCDRLETLRLPFIGDGGENDYIGYAFGADEPDENAIALPPSLDMIIVGERCESVSDEAFKGAKTLSAVTLHSNVKKIGKLAFYQCLDLVYVACGGVEEIGEYAFAFCKSLYDIDISSAESVAKGALYSTNSLHSITLKLGENDYLGRIFDAESADFNDELVPPSLRVITVAEGTESIPNQAFYACKYITEVNLPDSLVNVGVRSFYACRSLGEIIIPDNVKTIKDDAFFGCDNLASLTLGNSLETIGMQAFYGCGALVRVECPESLALIKSSAFYGCKSLVSVDLGGTKTVGKDAFGDCPALSPIDYSGVTVE